MEPLVSIMMPCYNAAATLPLALASLRAQTYRRWECILVDDGSTDAPQSIVEPLGDSRIRCVRHAVNRGRGTARRTAMDHISGDFLCMLDADDWIYPRKLELQVTALTAEPELGVVSAGMAIVDAGHHIIGARGAGTGDAATPAPPGQGLALPTVPFAPCMFRADVARATPYDPSLPAAEDADFLFRVLRQYPHRALPCNLYTYTEVASSSLDKILGRLRGTQSIFRKYRRDYPLQSRMEVARAGLKGLAYRAAFAMGQGERMVTRHSSMPATRDVEEFNAARDAVFAELERGIPAEAFSRI